METVSGYVEHIIFQNNENGYTVMNLMTEGSEVVCVGMGKGLTQGENIQVQGEYVEHPVYGTQLKMASFQVVVPKDSLGMERYLGSGAIKGVGPSLAARIVRQFGDDTFRIIEEEPERLAEVKGVSQRKARDIAVQMEEKRDLRDALVFLQQYGISNTLAVKIYETYGGGLYGVMKENPYRLAEDIHGIGFKLADELAAKIGIHTDSDYRIRSGIFYTLMQTVGEGHCYFPMEALLERAERLLGVAREYIRPQMDNLMMDKKLVIKGDQVFATSYYYAELNCARMLQELNISMMPGQEESSGDSREEGGRFADNADFGSGGDFGLGAEAMGKLGALAESLHMELDRLQFRAVAESIRNGLFLLSGGPGTGKTTTINMVIRYFEAEGLDILLAAPTGRAAKRMTEATGFEARTIHRLLEYKPPEGYQRNEEKPLEGDVLILDECSMIDIMLMYNLLKAIPEHMALIMVGDTDQLPSVGAGNVLKDVMASGCIPVVRLSRIFRQAQGSRIILNAHRINKGEAIDMRGGKDSDFFFASEETNEGIVERLVKYCTENLPRYYHADPLRDIQVLTPMQRGTVGAANLNQVLQEAMNPQGPALRRGGVCYRVRDKVMQIRNDYDKEVFNGDIGTIRRVDLEDREVTVDFDGREVAYDVTELDELALAYATTIHKAQGSEYPIVVMPFSMSHFVMLQRNLLYTGVTRAKKILVLIGEKKAVFYAVRNGRMAERNTRLAERILLADTSI